MDVWEVKGWELVPLKSNPEKHNIRLYVQRPLKEGVQGDGLECGRLYYNPDYCQYSPVLGQMIVAVEGRFGLDRVLVVG